MKNKKIISAAVTTGVVVTSFTPTLQALAQETKPVQLEKENTVSKTNLDSEILEAKTELEAKKESLDHSATALQEQVNKQSTTTTSYEGARVQSEALENQIQAVVVKAIEEKETQLQSINNEIDQVKEEVLTLEKTLSQQEQSLRKAKEDYDRVSEEYERVLSDTSDLNTETLNAKKAEYEEAVEEYDKAQQLLAQKQQALEEASRKVEEQEQELQKAKIEAEKRAQEKTTADEAVAQAQKDVDSTKEELETLSDLNAKEKLEEELKKEESALEEAKLLQEQAKQNFDEAQKILQNLNSQAALLTQQLTQKEAEYKAAQEVSKDKEETLKRLQSELEALKANQESTAAEKETVESQLSTKEAELDSAKTELEAVKAQVAETQEQLVAVKTKLQELEAKQANAQNDEVSNSIRGFFMSLQENGKKALEILGENNNGMRLDQLQRSLEYIKESNTLRSRHQLAPLKVSPALMAIADVQARKSTEVWETRNEFNHSLLYPVGENIALVPTTGDDADPYKGWYTEEKMVYDYLQSHDLTIDQVNQDPELKTRIAKELGLDEDIIQIGHYESIVNPSYAYTGYAYIDTVYNFPESSRSRRATVNSIPMYFHSQTFSMNPTYNVGALTPEEYLTKLDAYRDSLVSNVDSTELEKVRQNVEDSKNALMQLQSKQSDLERTVTAKDTEVQSFEERKVNLDAKLNEISQQIASKESAIEDVKTSDGNTSVTNDEIEVLKTQLASLNDQISRKKEETTELENALTNANQAVEAKIKTIDDLQNKAANLDQAKEEVKEKLLQNQSVLEKAQEKQNQAETNVLNAKGKVSEIEEKQVLVKQQVEDAKQDVRTAESALQDAADKKEQTKKAYTSLKEKVDLVGISSKNKEVAKRQVNMLQQDIQVTEKRISENEQILLQKQNIAKEHTDKLKEYNLLKEEVRQVLSGKDVTFFASNDSFVESVRNQYESLKLAKAKEETLRVQLEVIQKDKQATEKLYQEALKNYNEAKANYDKLIEQMNKQIEEEIKESKNSKDKKKDKKSKQEVKTSTNLSLETTLILTGLSGAGVVLSRRKKNAHLYEK